MALDAPERPDQATGDPGDGGLEEVTDPREMRDMARQDAANQFARGMGQKVGKWAGQNKRKMAIGGIAGGLVTAMIAGFFALLPLKLLHFKELLFDRNFAVGEDFERVRGYRMMRTMLKGHAVNDNGSRRVVCTTGGFVCDRMTNWRLDRFDAKLEKRGIKLEYGPIGADGRPGGLTRITDLRTGVDLDLSTLDDIGRQKALFRAIDEAIPAWRIGKRIKYRSLMTRRAGVKWKFFRRAGDPESDEGIRPRVDDRINGRDHDADLSRTADVDSDGDGTADSSSPDANLGEGETREVVDDVASDISDGDGTVRGATRLSMRARIGIGISGLIASVCGLSELLDGLGDTVTVERTTQLINSGNLLLTNAADLKGGTLDGQDLNDFMRLFETYETVEESDAAGNATGSSHQKYAGAETAVAYKLASDEPVTDADRRERDLSEDAHPSRSAVGRLDEALDDIISFVPGGAAICNVVGSPFAQVVLTLGELGAAIWSGGASAAAGAAVSFAAGEAISRTVMPRLIGYILNASVSGFVDGFQFMNNMDAGLLLSASQDASNSGAPEATREQFEGKYGEVKRQAAAEFSQQSIAHKLFSPDDHRSLISKLAGIMPVTKQHAVTQLAALPRTIPRAFFGLLLGTKPALANGTPNPFGAEVRYNFRLYAYTDEQLARYEFDFLDPYMVEPIAVVPPANCLTGSPALITSNERGIVLKNGYDWHCVNAQGTRVAGPFHRLGYGEACYDIEYDNHAPIVGGQQPDPPYTDNNTGICKSFGTSTKDDSTGGGIDAADITPITDADIRSYLYCPGSNGNCPSTTPASNDEMLRYQLYRLDSNIACNYETGMSETAPSAECPQGPEGGAGASSVAPTAGAPTAVTGTHQELASRLLGNPLFSVDGDVNRQDIENGLVKDSVIIVLIQIVEQLRVPIKVSSTVSDHSRLTTTGRVSNHSLGLAVDIGNEEVAPTLLPWMYQNRQALNLNELIFARPPAGVTTLFEGQDHEYDCITLWGIRDPFCDGQAATPDGIEGHEDHIHFSVME